MFSEIKNKQTMDWTNEECLKFLECYKNEPCIWNPEHAAHKDRRRVADAWKRIHETLNFNCDLNDLKKKKDSLMASFRSLRRRTIKSNMTGDEMYRPIWFAFEPMEQFLGPLYPLHNPNTEENFVNFLMDTDEQSNVSEMASFKIHENDVENAEFKSGITKNYTPRKISSQKTLEMQIKVGHGKQEAIAKNIDIEETEKNMEQAIYNVLKGGTTKEPAKDDCDFYAALLATKLRRFDVLQREEIMLEIDSYLLKKRRNVTDAVLV